MRKNVRMIAFLCAAVLLLASAAAVGTVRAARYKRELENGYARAVNGLTESVTGIDIELHKCICAGTPEGFSGAAEQILSYCQQGKIHAGELPVGAEWDGIERFLAQACDYVCALENKESLTENEYGRLITLSDSAQELRLLLEDFIELSYDNGSWHNEWERLAFHTGNLMLFSGASALAGAGESFGMINDDIPEQTPALLSGSDIVPAGKAKAAAEKAAGVQLYCSGESDGAAEEYIFTSTDRKTEVAVTKRRGTVAYMIKDVTSGEPRISAAEAGAKAEVFLRSVGLSDMCAVQHSVYDGMCVVSFAPVQDGIILYPDRVNVSVTLDRGAIAAYDAADYIMNHRERTLAAGVTCAEAQEAVSDMLSVEDSRLVLIRTESGEETLCYEFICKRWDDGEAAVYINAESMREEQILLLSRTEDGNMMV